MSKPKFVRMWIELEVEVTDPIKMAAHNLNFTSDTGNGPGMLDIPYERQVHQAVNGLLMQALIDNSDRTGIKPISASGWTRTPDESGDMFPEVVIPAMPVRKDDGSTPAWDL